MPVLIVRQESRPGTPDGCPTISNAGPTPDAGALILALDAPPLFAFATRSSGRMHAGARRSVR